MTSYVKTVCFSGIEALEVDVQVQVSKGGLPCFNIVGLANKSVDESKERIRGALADSGMAFPNRRITVNLAPANIVKEGSHFDLPIAIGILCETGVLTQAEIAGYLFVGELGLDGSLAATPGVLPAAIKANHLELGFACPARQGGEAAWSGNRSIIAADDVVSLVNYLKHPESVRPPHTEKGTDNFSYIDFKDIKGQVAAKRAAEIAAAGGHNMLMIGPPGCGKSMLAEAINGILPPMTSEEILEVSQIYSVAGLIKDGHLISKRQYRKPHHSTTTAGMVGSASSSGRARPGEVSFAHHGVLFLDELPEFPRATLEALRLPLETGQVLIARANSHIAYPAKFQLVVAMNPCRCGYLGKDGFECSRAPKCGEEYMAKISGPFLDRIDIHVEMQEVPMSRMMAAADANAEDSATVAQRVRRAWEMQACRYKDMGKGKNSEIDGKTLEKYVALDDASKALMADAAGKFAFSARGYHRVLRVARTIADVEGAETVNRNHIFEALSYRRVSRGGRF